MDVSLRIHFFPFFILDIYFSKRYIILITIKLSYVKYYWLWYSLYYCFSNNPKFVVYFQCVHLPEMWRRKNCNVLCRFYMCITYKCICTMHIEYIHINMLSTLARLAPQCRNIHVDGKYKMKPYCTNTFFCFINFNIVFFFFKILIKFWDLMYTCRYFSL